MLIISQLNELKNEIAKLKLSNQTIGFVPTMGALHEGHLSLVAKSIEENDKTIVSIFVNPTQFGKNEDLEKYPRPIEKDQKLLQEAGTAIIFRPSNEVIYLGDPDLGTIIFEPSLSKKLCGLTRPDHFQGVCSIVLRLFNLIQPTRAYFGEKDFQQLTIIKKMVHDLFLNVEIISCPIIREKNGLALSSRNSYLTAVEKEEASFIYQSLRLIHE
ncbi:MAG: pantoate--beta-alanine ligase, partial [Candidatus Margulisiibacteriota bacterium]